MLYTVLNMCILCSEIQRLSERDTQMSRTLNLYKSMTVEEFTSQVNLSDSLHFKHYGKLCSSPLDHAVKSH